MRQINLITVPALTCCFGLLSVSCTGTDAPADLDGFYNAEESILDISTNPSDPQVTFDFTMDTKSGDDTPVKTCSDAAALTEDNIRPYEWKSFLWIKASCKSAETYLDAVDARKSFLRGIDFEDLIADLPSETAPHVEPTPPPSGGTISRQFGSYSSTKLTETKIETEYDGYKVFYTNAALRDINADGVEDMLILVDANIKEGSWGITQVIAISKLSATDPVQVLWTY